MTMKFISQIILALALVFTVPPLVTGCQTAPNVEGVAYTTVAAAHTGFKTALKLWSVSYAKREKANDATRESDPGGYLERQNALLKEDGRIRVLQANFTAAETLAVESWLAAKKAGLPAPADPKPSSDMLFVITEVKTLTK